MKKYYCNVHPAQNLAMASKARSDRRHGGVVISHGLGNRDIHIGHVAS
jgi:hypothetical protein